MAMDDKNTMRSVFEKLRRAHAADAEKTEVSREESPAAPSPAAELQEAVPAEDSSSVLNGEASTGPAAEEVPVPQLSDTEAMSEIIDAVLAENSDEDDATVARKAQALFAEYKATGILPVERPAAQPGLVDEIVAAAEDAKAAPEAPAAFSAEEIVAAAAEYAAAEVPAADSVSAQPAEEYTAAEEPAEETVDETEEKSEEQSIKEPAAPEAAEPKRETPEAAFTAEAAPVAEEPQAPAAAQENAAEEIPEPADVPDAAEETINAPAAEPETRIFAEEAEAQPAPAEAEPPKAQVVAVPAEEPKPAGADEDILLAALGYSEKKEGKTAERQVKTNRYVSRPADLKNAFGYSGKAYQSRAQRGTILRTFDDNRKLWMVRAVGTGFFTILLLIFDLFGDKFSGALSAANYPVVNLMVSLQLLLLCAVFSARALKQGIVGILETRPVPASITACAVFGTILYDIIQACALRASAAPFTLYHSPVALCLCVQLASDYLKLQFEKNNFDRLSKMESICVLQKRREGVYTLRRTNFVNGFFRHTNLYNTNYSVLNYVMAPVTALALILFIVALAAGRGFIGAIGTFAVCLQLAMPVFAVAAMDLPFYLLNLGNGKNSGLVLHENDTADFGHVEKIVLDETDMFRGGALKFMDLAPQVPDYDYFRDLNAVSAVCSAVGGTISRVFETVPSDTEATEKSPDVTVHLVTEGGISADVDGRAYLIGSCKFLNDNGIPCLPDAVEERAGHSYNVILHIAVDRKEMLRVYLVYQAGPAFTDLLHRLSEKGVEVELHCFDPNLNPDFVAELIGDPHLKLQVVRVDSPERELTDPAAAAALYSDGDDPVAVISLAEQCGAYRRLSAFYKKVLFGMQIALALLALVLCAFGAAVGMSPAYILLVYIVTLVFSFLVSRMV